MVVSLYLWWLTYTLRVDCALYYSPSDERFEVPKLDEVVDSLWVIEYLRVPSWLCTALS